MHTTGKGNDQVRFEMCAQALDASLTTIAPWRDPEFLEKFKGRVDLLAYASAHNIPVDATPKAPYSLDANLYHTSYESGMLENPMTPPMEDMFRMTVSPEAAPDAPTFLRIEFEHGIPTKIVNKTTGVEHTDPLDGFNYLNEVAGANGVGRIDIVENRFVGIKSRGMPMQKEPHYHYTVHIMSCAHCSNFFWVFFLRIKLWTTPAQMCLHIYEY